MHRTTIWLVLLCCGASLAAEQKATQAVDHTAWDRLLKAFVNAEHQVDYGRWKREALPELDSYLERLAGRWPATENAGERKAALINAYNALVVRWILSSYPVESVWKTKNPFDKARHRLDGQTVSLDAIETELRRTDVRVHSVLVCAARSCPPLRREAYTASRLDEQLDDNSRRWLANPRLNRFDPAEKRAEVSSIFKWYRGDFDNGVNTLGRFLEKYGPPEAAFLRSPASKIGFLDYDWSLNDAQTGSTYSPLSFYLDYFRNKLFGGR